jgi:hypothetical protein
MNLRRLLEARAASGKPVRVALIGAGKFGSMYLSQARRTPGIHLLAVVDLILPVRALPSRALAGPVARTTPPRWITRSRRARRASPTTPRRRSRIRRPRW